MSNHQVDYKKITRCCALAAALTTGIANAGDDAFFASLKWDVGGGSQPNLLLGYRDVDSRNNNNNINGISFSVDYDFDHGFNHIIVKSFNGGLNAQVEFGAGYSLQAKNIYGTVGLQGSYFNLSYDLGAGVDRLNGEINTIGKYDETTNTASAPSGPSAPTDGAPA